jgi:hypothetical protein
MKNSLTVITVAALVVLVPGCGKTKPTDASGSGSATANTGSGSGDAATGSAAGASGPASSGGAVWTDKPDPLQQAVLDAIAAKVAAIGKKDPSLVGQIIDATAAAHASVAREAWDPAAVITSVGKDRAALFKWVRDNTALVPYRGSLRGAVGVMMDRVGNSLDRALLLADVLGKAGLEVRLANAQLSPDLVAKLVAATKTRARPALPSAHIDDAALIGSIAKLIGGDAKAIEAGSAREKAAGDALLARTRTRVEAQARALGALVPASGAASGAAPSTGDAFVDHWWLQVHDGDAWSDLDPSLPAAAPGEALASTATDTLAPGDLGDDRRHTLAIRVIGEVWHGDTREETVLLDHAFAPGQFFGQRIVVTNVALDLPDDKAVLAAPDHIAFVKKALIAQTEFAPMIRIGTTPVMHFSVNDRGELTDLTAGDGNTIRLARAVQHATKDGVGGATGMLDQMPGESTAGSGSGSAPPAPAPAPPALTAEWLEIEIRTPGADPKVVRRTLFDNLGAVADRNAAHPPVLSDDARLERAYALSGETELLPMFAQIPDAFVADRTVKALVAARDVLVAAAARKGLDAQREKLATLASIPGPLYALAVQRFADAGVYLDRLDVLALRRRIVPHDKTIGLRNEVDILANQVAVWPTSKDPRAARIAQGVRDTDLELLAVSCPPRAPCVRAPTTAELFAASSGKDWSVIAAPQGLARTDQTAGYAIVARNASPRTWWRIDAATGETLGMNPLGGNAATEEAALQQAMVENFISGVVNLTFCLWDHRAAGSAAAIVDASAACGFAAAVGAMGGVVGTGLGGGRGLTLALALLSNLAGRLTD